MFGMGATVGDYDNDGWDDLFIAAYGHDHLFHNDHGVFTDVTAHAGVAGDSEWHTSAMFVDYDNDGKLDLFVVPIATGRPTTICIFHYLEADQNVRHPRRILWIDEPFVSQQRQRHIHRRHTQSGHL